MSIRSRIYLLAAAVVLTLALPVSAGAQATTTTTVMTTTTVRSTTTQAQAGTTSTTLPPALQCQNRAAAVHATLARRLLQCERVAGRRQARGNPFDKEVCRGRAVQRFDRRYPKKLQKQLCPSCVRDGHETLRVAAEQLVFALPSSSCDEGDQLKASKCTASALRRLSTLLGDLAECRVKAAIADFKTDQFDETKCQRRARRQYDQAVERLEGCPPCLDADVRTQSTRSPIDEMLRMLDDRVAHCSCAHGSGVCDDGNACTTGVCDDTNGNCTHVSTNNGGACPDFNNDGNSCTTGVCNGSGRCQMAAANDGNACPDDDDSPCTSGVCRNMVCMPMATNEGGPCVDDGNGCTDDRCESGECAHPARANGTSCGDGNLCNGEEACLNGACEDGFAPLCPEDERNSCTEAICDPIVGCTFEFINEGQLCQDGDACTFGDVCEQGVCEGIPLDCDDGIDCTIDTCSALFGCVSNDTRACQP
jgi:hypothetical protein